MWVLANKKEFRPVAKLWHAQSGRSSRIALIGRQGRARPDHWVNALIKSIHPNAVAKNTVALKENNSNKASDKASLHYAKT
jgi:hypothetical protein